MSESHGTVSADRLAASLSGNDQRTSGVRDFCGERSCGQREKSETRGCVLRSTGGKDSMTARKLRHQKLLVACLHAAVISASLILAWLLQFDSSIPRSEIRVLLWGLALALPIKLAVYLYSRLSRPVWIFSDTVDIARLLGASVIASAAFAVASYSLRPARAEVSTYVVDFMNCFLLMTGLEVAPRVYARMIVRSGTKEGTRGILIYGSGVAGSMLAREIRQNPKLKYTVLGFLDDDHSRRDAMMMGVPVLGTGRDAKDIVYRLSLGSRKAQEIIIAVPSANARQMEDIISNC